MNIPERPKSKLVFGAIPAHTECPFLEECSKGTMKCFVGHQGKEHSVDFSCAIARGFDICSSKKIKMRIKYDEPSKCPDLTGLVFLENKKGTYWKVCGKADKGWSFGCIYPLIKCNKNGKEYTRHARFGVEGLIELSKLNDGETYNLHGCNYTKVGQAKSNEKITLKNPELTAIRMNIANCKSKIKGLENELNYEKERLKNYEEEMIKLMGCEELI